MKVRAVVLLTVLAAVWLVGCSEGAASYAGISDLKADVVSAGIDCDRAEPGPDAELVKDSLTCIDRGVTLYLFDDAAALADWAKVGTRLSPTLIGPNWAATGEEQTLEQLAGELGGELTGPDS